MTEQEYIKNLENALRCAFGFCINQDFCPDCIMQDTCAKLQEILEKKSKNFEKNS